MVQANFQTAGRGRLGRKWVAKSEAGLLFSMLLAPSLPESLGPLIGLIVSLGIFDAIADEIGDPTELNLRWPNDLLYGGQKLAGILCESAHSAEGKNLIIAGVGLNVNQLKEDFDEDFRTPATSLHLITGHHRSPKKLLPQFLKSIGDYLDRLEIEGWNWVSREWMERAGLIGRYVDVADGSNRTCGVLEEIQVDGALVINQGNGIKRIVRSGEFVR